MDTIQRLASKPPTFSKTRSQHKPSCPKGDNETLRRLGVFTAYSVLVLFICNITAQQTTSCRTHSVCCHLVISLRKTTLLRAYFSIEVLRKKKHIIDSNWEVCTSHVKFHDPGIRGCPYKAKTEVRTWKTEDRKTRLDT